MKTFGTVVGFLFLAVAILVHAAIPRYEVIASSPSQAIPTTADVVYRDFYGAARYPGLVKLDRWTGSVYVGSFINGIDGPPRWVWNMID